ncbi:hypothetical protein [Streptomyces spectabilis]|uniref:Uncharacterized protein n=1 Tax=Streptomyces spectabilis TaxID=68270 RepID=A0A5P2X0P3_STRST|nr:hypothetical protein [Streptomyces spectabilis]MBB5108331.1 hypothetical protein [Streptomyces spectabilis]MCI3901089.1 hypothetical protein [Streptomyces spectabilis]QEV58583.1 hypothetical protein CP982_07530 [Streptomyces spectabilis]GGV45910.1 hypothetical protein GCM10010245_71930 [Streptomyces spectabilis]
MGDRTPSTSNEVDGSDVHTIVQSGTTDTVDASQTTVTVTHGDGTTYINGDHGQVSHTFNR